MKKKLLMISILLCGWILQHANGQIPVNASVNIGQQPSWGPAGYNHVEYYYLPDIDTYYYVPKREYIYLDGAEWKSSTVVPARYRSYDFNRGYKAVINEPYPYRRADVYRIKYKKFKGNQGKKIIGNNRSKNDIIKQKGNSSNSHGKIKAHGNSHKKGNGHGNGNAKGGKH